MFYKSTPNNEENGNMERDIYIYIITLNVNRLNVATKRNRLAEQIQKQDPYIYMLSTRNLLHA